MVAKDGIPFAKFITSINLRQLFESEGHKLPSSASTIQTMVMAYGASIQKKTVEELVALKNSKHRFTLTFDEWSSIRNRRYLNLNIHVFTAETVRLWNLGLVRIFGSFPAESCIIALEKKLKEFNIQLERDIVAVTTDGAAIMKKVGRLLSAHHQLGYAHGLQLAVCDVLYKSKDTHKETEEEYVQEQGSEEADDEEQGVFSAEDEFPEVDLLPRYRELVDKVRKIVKLFSSKSPMRNDLLQNYIKAEFGRELQLVKDCKTRWSSLAAMITRFNMVKQCISKALIDLRLTSSLYSFTEEEYITLIDIERSLEPVKLAVNVLCRDDATLLTAETTLRFMINKLQNQNTTLSNELVNSLRCRIKERRTSMTSVLLYLENPVKYLERNSASTDDEDIFIFPNKALLRKEIKGLIERLLSDPSPEAQAGPQSGDMRVDDHNEDEDENIPLSDLLTRRESSTSTTEDELDRTLRTEWVALGAESSPAYVPPRASLDLDLILKHETTLFECGQ